MIDIAVVYMLIVLGSVIGGAVIGGLLFLMVRRYYYRDYIERKRKENP